MYWYLQRGERFGIMKIGFLKKIWSQKHEKNYFFGFTGSDAPADKL